MAEIKGLSQNIFLSVWCCEMEIDLFPDTELFFFNLVLEQEAQMVV